MEFNYNALAQLNNRGQAITYGGSVTVPREMGAEASIIAAHAAVTMIPEVLSGVVVDMPVVSTEDEKLWEPVDDSAPEVYGEDDYVAVEDDVILESESGDLCVLVGIMEDESGDRWIMIEDESGMLSEIHEDEWSMRVSPTSRRESLAPQLAKFGADRLRAANNLIIA